MKIVKMDLNPGTALDNAGKFQSFVRLPTLALVALLAGLALHAQSPSIGQWKLSLRGFGPILIGMSKAQAEKLAGAKLVQEPEQNSGCFYASFHGGNWGNHSDVVFTYSEVQDRIERIEINDYGTGNHSTVSGVGVGDPIEKAQKAYGDKLKEIRDPSYTDPHWLFIPVDASDMAYRMLFLVEKGKITNIVIGKVNATGDGIETTITY